MSLWGGAVFYLSIVEPIPPQAAAPATLIESLAWMTAPPIAPLLPPPTLTPSWMPVPVAAAPTPAFGWWTLPVDAPHASFTPSLFEATIETSGPPIGSLFRRSITWRTGSRPWIWG